MAELVAGIGDEVLLFGSFILLSLCMLAFISRRQLLQRRQREQEQGQREQGRGHDQLKNQGLCIIRARSGNSSFIFYRHLLHWKELLNQQNCKCLVWHSSQLNCSCGMHNVIHESNDVSKSLPSHRRTRTLNTHVPHGTAEQDQGQESPQSNSDTATSHSAPPPSPTQSHDDEPTEPELRSRFVPTSGTPSQGGRGRGDGGATISLRLILSQNSMTINVRPNCTLGEIRRYV